MKNLVVSMLSVFVLTYAHVFGGPLTYSYGGKFDTMHDCMKKGQQEENKRPTSIKYHCVKK